MNKSYRKKWKSLLEAHGIEDRTVQVETYNPDSKKPHIELRNYNKMMVDFFMEIPKGLADQEMAILEAKLKRGELLSDELEKQMSLDQEPSSED